MKARGCKTNLLKMIAQNINDHFRFFQNCLNVILRKQNTRVCIGTENLKNLLRLDDENLIKVKMSFYGSG